MIPSRCATSWYQVCREFCYKLCLNIGTFTALNLHITLKNLKYLFAVICAFQMWAVSVSQSTIFTNRSIALRVSVN
jgi:hypothetical protein